MRTTAFLTVSLLACAVARAGEEDLVRFQEQTIRMAEALDAAVVRVGAPSRAGNWATVVEELQPLGQPEAQKYQRLWLRDRRRGLGILVGSPARVVVAHAQGQTPQLDVRLPDGRSVKASRLASDAGLGIAVYALPDGVELSGLEVERDWGSLRAGAIVMSRNGTLELGLVQSEDRRLGRIRAGHAPAGLALVTVRGRLAGIAVGAGPVAGARSLDVYTASRLTYVNTGSRDVFVAGPVVARALDDLAGHGAIRRGFLGVVLGDEAGSGAARIDSVLDGSPAAGAGLAEGDRILEVDGVACNGSATLSRVLALKRPGEEVRLIVRGAEASREVSVVLADRAQAQAALLDEESLGFTCVDLGGELRGWLGLDDDVRGAVVQDVRRGGVAVAAGLRRGDVIVGGGGGDVADVAELRAVLAAAKGETSLRVLRDGRTFDLTVKLPRPGGTR